ncbi:MAG: carbamoyltransferase [Mycobacterium sp.]|uniref:carbamoyltransferase family protein n=1 Tax=Mycobacterium sp. TaxID=1785 RepID=UPI0026112E1E|nr:carbamoyltransferase [Mycobacterium sp.]MDI3315331.1 carbamoyltransferase [Mycobacterium sp.]
MTAILGISAYYHDAAAALVVDGALVAAAQEERFTRRKHDPSFPAHAVAYCLQEGGLTAEDLDHVVFYEKPFLKFERLLETYAAFAPRGFRSYVRAMPVWLTEKLHLPREIRRQLAGYTRRLSFVEHHESHAASAFFPSPFDEAAILTFDGVGEWATATMGTGRGNRIRLHAELRFPHSLGMLYSAFTYFTGFKVNSGEYKLMGLAPYGEPIYAEKILDKLVDLRDDGSFRLDLRYFDYCTGLKMTSKRFDELFDGPPRAPESPITQREMDLAASVQRVTEEIVVRAARHLQATTQLTNLCLAGGVALNCVANSRILRDTPFERIWVQPAAGDAGGALGAALFVWHQLLDRERAPHGRDSQRGSFLGPSYRREDVTAALARHGATYRLFDDEAELCDVVAGLLADGNVVGWFHGRMEFGPRALGARSILGDPRSPGMQSVMNQKIKFRESFRPFAPAVLLEHVDDWFERAAGEESPYMLLVAPVAPARRTPAAAETAREKAHGLDKLGVVRSSIPAVTHVDLSARLQTVDAERHGRFHLLLQRFYQRTGCPVLVNTSFNVRGEPIVCTPDDAFRCFMATQMDALVLEDAVLLKSEQRGTAPVQLQRYLREFSLD